MKKQTGFLACLLLTSLSCVHPLVADSDGKVSVAITLSQDKGLQYEVRFKNVVVVETSPLGITVDGIDLGAGVTIGQPTKSLPDETYATRGNHKQARNHHIAWRYPVTHASSGREYTLEFHVYNDGVAYRYVVPGNSGVPTWLR